MNDLYSPLQSLREGHWFKLICGASFQHLPAVRNLTLAYALAGADCVDVAADPAVVVAAQDALRTASTLAQANPGNWPHFKGTPWLMVSLNDGEDPHFRKAAFNPDLCPVDCPRPCEAICPAQAIIFGSSLEEFSGVIDRRCYGCGRCLPVCPIQQISTWSYVSTTSAIAPLVLAGVDAVEIHTQIGRLADFERLWQAIEPWVPRLKLIAISCPGGEGFIEYLRALYDRIAPLPTPLIWQTDGRPMSGDVGNGATRAAVKLGQQALAARLPGYIQLAGGTNRHTVEKLRSLQLLPPEAHDQHVSGIAYGSYARVLLAEVLHQLETSPHPFAEMTGDFPVVGQPSNIPEQGGEILRSTTGISTPIRLEEVPDLLRKAVDLARSIVEQLKPAQSTEQRMLNPQLPLP